MHQISPTNPEVQASRPEQEGSRNPLTLSNALAFPIGITVSIPISPAHAFTSQTLIAYHHTEQGQA
jgi:hypothetical protein